MSRIVLFTLLLLCLVPGHALAQFQLLNGGGFDVQVNVSDDGSTIVWAEDFSNPASGSILDRGTGQVSTFLNVSSGVTIAPVVSSDGSVVAGSYVGTGGGGWTAYSVVDGTRIDEPGNDMQILDLSGDGRIRVGRSGSIAARSENGVTTLLGDVPGGQNWSWANAITPDGTAIVGRGQSAAGSEALVWFNGNVRALPELPGGQYGSGANAVSDSGREIVGFSDGFTNSKAVYWTRFGVRGPFEIPSPSTRFLQNMVATDVTSDGSVIVGSGRSSGQDVSWIWDAENGTRELHVFLESMGIDTQFTRLESVSISADGQVLSGAGFQGEYVNPDTGTYLPGAGPVLWYAVIPEPGTALLLGLGLAGLAARRERA